MVAPIEAAFDPTCCVEQPHQPTVVVWTMLQKSLQMLFPQFETCSETICLAKPGSLDGCRRCFFEVVQEFMLETVANDVNHAGRDAGCHTCLRGLAYLFRFGHVQMAASMSR